MGYYSEDKAKLKEMLKKIDRMFYKDSIDFSKSTAEAENRAAERIVRDRIRNLYFHSIDDKGNFKINHKTKTDLNRQIDVLKSYHLGDRNFEVKMQGILDEEKEWAKVKKFNPGEYYRQYAKTYSKEELKNQVKVAANWINKIDDDFKEMDDLFESLNRRSRKTGFMAFSLGSVIGGISLMLSSLVSKDSALPVMLPGLSVQTAATIMGVKYLIGENPNKINNIVRDDKQLREIYKEKVGVLENFSESLRDTDTITILDDGDDDSNDSENIVNVSNKNVKNSGDDSIYIGGNCISIINGKVYKDGKLVAKTKKRNISVKTVNGKVIINDEVFEADND